MRVRIEMGNFPSVPGLFDQITVRRTGGPKLDEQEIYLAADYSRPMHLLVLTFTLHFTPEARHQFHPVDWR